MHSGNQLNFLKYLNYFEQRVKWFTGGGRKSDYERIDLCTLCKDSRAIL